jgi:hypothetical protein
LFSSCQNCSIKRTHWAHPACAVFLLPAGTPSRDAGMLRTGVNPFESGTWALFLVVTHGLVYAGLLGSFAGCLSLFAA